MTFLGRISAVNLVFLVAACAGTPPPSTAVVAAAPPPDPVVTPAPKPSAESLTIEFGEANAALTPAAPGSAGGCRGSSTAPAALTPEAKAQLDGAARLYRDAKPEIMIISGHTDKVGSEFGNIILSAKRAVSVKKALVDRGVPADRLQIVAVGSAEPIPTIPPSRSAVVTWR